MSIKFIFSKWIGQNINIEWTQHFCPFHVLRAQLRIYISLEVSIKDSYLCGFACAVHYMI